LYPQSKKNTIHIGEIIYFCKSFYNSKYLNDYFQCIYWVVAVVVVVVMPLVLLSPLWLIAGFCAPTFYFHST